jgi:hypothetical protein
VQQVQDLAFGMVRVSHRPHAFMCHRAKHFAIRGRSGGAITCGEWATGADYSGALRSQMTKLTLFLWMKRYCRLIKQL